MSTPRTPVPRWVAPATAVLAVAAVVLTVLVAVRSGPVVRLDTAVLDAVNRSVAAHRGQVGPWKAVSAVLGPTVLRMLAVVVVVVAWWRRHRRTAVLVAVGMLGAAVLSTGLKVLLDRPRPRPAVVLDTAAGASFPSGHALTSVAAAALLLAVLAPRLRSAARAGLIAVAVLAVAAVGASRLALADHFPSDVLGGWLLGAAWVGVSVLLAARLVPGRP
ncbi:phosphatase PAP2 family protein [Rhodococcus aerolatus]